MCMNLSTYHNTENQSIIVFDPNLQLYTPHFAWPQNAKVWPTNAYTAIAAMSTFLGGLVLLSYLCGVMFANKLNGVARVFRILMMVVMLTLWVYAVCEIRVQKGPTSLWGYACGQGKMAQDLFPGVNYVQFCGLQVSPEPTSEQRHVSIADSRGFLDQCLGYGNYQRCDDVFNWDFFVFQGYAEAFGETTEEGF